MRREEQIMEEDKKRGIKYIEKNKGSEEEKNSEVKEKYKTRRKKK